MTKPQNGLAAFVTQNVVVDDIAAAGDDILRIAKDIANSDPNARLEEFRFVQIFLPLFDGTPAEERPFPVDMSNWSTVAGSVYRSVDVVDRQGVVLFTVPPMIDRVAVRPVNQKEGFGGVYDMAVMAQRLQYTSPRHAKAFMDGQLSARASAMFNPENIFKYLRTWNEIFKRYGRPPILDLDELKTRANKPTDAPSNASDPEVDDWELM